MTDIQELVNNVIDREKAKFDQVIEEFEGQSQAETEAEKAKLAQEFAGRKSNLERDFKGQVDIAKNSISLRKRDKVLSVKRDLINQFIKEVETSFANLDQETVKEFIQTILQEYQGRDGIVLVFASETRDLLGDSLGEITQGFQLSDQSIEGQAGFIIQEGSLQYNYLFDNLVNNARKRLEALIVKQVLNK